MERREERRTGRGAQAQGSATTIRETKAMTRGAERALYVDIFSYEVEVRRGGHGKEGGTKDRKRGTRPRLNHNHQRGKDVSSWGVNDTLPPSI